MTEHSYERQGLCRGCASVHGCEIWRHRSPQTIVLVSHAQYDERDAIFGVVSDTLRGRGLAVTAMLLVDAWEDLDPAIVSCMEAIRTCDAALFEVTDEFYRGTSEETDALLVGYALACERRVICVGTPPDARPYRAIPQIEHVQTWDAALVLLGASKAG